MPAVLRDRHERSQCEFLRGFVENVEADAKLCKRVLLLFKTRWSVEMCSVDLERLHELKEIASLEPEQPRGSRAIAGGLC
jgi:hypothetical protein